jgi:hypothetical protein
MVVVPTLVRSLSGLPFLVFFGLVCYALSVSNTAEVNEACGARLWKLILAHLVVPIGLSLVIVVGTVVVVICAFGFSDTGESNLPIVMGVVTALVMLAYCSLFLGLGYPIVREAMYSEACVKALSHVSFTHTPLLGILGCIYLVFDVIVLSLLVLALLLLAGFMLFFTGQSTNSFALPAQTHMHHHKKKKTLLPEEETQPLFHNQKELENFLL